MVFHSRANARRVLVWCWPRPQVAGASEQSARAIAETLIGEFTNGPTVNDGGVSFVLEYHLDPDELDFLRVRVVPLPAGAWLFLSGLTLLGALRRRTRVI